MHGGLAVARASSGVGQVLRQVAKVMSIMD
jgi:hypothetical protein